KKIGGVPAYKLARKKQEVELKAKPVEVKEFEIVNWDGERARFKAWVSSGTYVQSLARELGEAPGPGAHLEDLTRTAVREFELEEAHSLEEVEARTRDPQGKPDHLHNTHYQTLDIGTSGDLLLHPRLVLPEFPAVTAPPEALVKIRHGAAVNLPYFPQPGAPTPHHAQTQNARVPGTPAAALPTLARVFENQTRLIGIARRIAGTLFHPKVVLI